MRIVVADTGPLNYLALIGESGLLSQLFETVVVPEVVRDELGREHTPQSVRAWMDSRPAWLRVVPTPAIPEDLQLPALDAGERAAIALALLMHLDLILIDDRTGATAARARGLAVMGTLGVLDRAAQRGLVDLSAAVAALQATNFHIRQDLLDLLLAQDRERRSRQ